MSKARDRRMKTLRKARNVRSNSTSCMSKIQENKYSGYVLESRESDGSWLRQKAYTFKTQVDINKYLLFIESLRAKNDQNIIEARIVDIVTGQVVKHIPAYEPTNTLETADAS